MAFKTAEDASQSMDGLLSAERLQELAEAGYAPHFFIDGKGPYFKITELKEWVHKNLVQARGGLPMPSRLSLVLEPSPRPASEAPTAISHLDGLCHIESCHLWCPGVYFLCQGDEVVYVGQSINVPSRIMTHIQSGLKQFDRTRIYYLPVPESELLKLETMIIQKLKPRYNGGQLSRNARRVI